MKFNTGIFDAMFGEKMTIQIEQGNGIMKDVVVTKAWWEKMQKEGVFKVVKLGSPSALARIQAPQTGYAQESRPNMSETKPHSKTPCGTTNDSTTTTDAPSSPANQSKPSHRRSCLTPELERASLRTRTLKEHLTRAWNDKKFQGVVAERIQRFVPSLPPDLAMKTSLGTIGKLVSAIMSGWSREAWEKNVCDMLQNSPPMKFTSGEALTVCRLVENDLRRFFGWQIEIPDPSELNDNAIYVNAETGGICWLLSRGDDKLVVVGVMLISLFLLSMQKGWAAKDLQSAGTGPRIELDLRPCEISDQEARNLARTIRAAYSIPAVRECYQLFQQLETLITFFDGGGFRIVRAPDAVAKRRADGVLFWKPY